MSACPRPRRDAILAFARDVRLWGKLRELAERAPPAHVVDLDGLCALVLNTVVESFAGIDIECEDDVLRAYQALCFRLFHLDVFLPYQRRGETPRAARAAARALKLLIGVAQDAPFPRDPGPVREGLEALFACATPLFQQ